jgi:chlorophyll synthase
MILIPVWTFYLLGAYHGSTAAGLSMDWRRLLLGGVSFTALLGAIYIVNQISDREVDRANEKLFLISHGIIPVRVAWIEAVLLIAVSFGIGIFYLPTSYIIIISISLALGFAYSVEPLRFKGRVILDVLSNAVGNGILNTFAGWVAAGATLGEWKILLPYPFAVASVHLTTTLADIEGDRSGGLGTSGMYLGRRWGIVLSTCLMAVAAGIAHLVGNRLALYASLFSLPFFLLPARSDDRPASQQSILLPTKTATLIFSIAAGFIFRLYIPFLAVVILLTRLYYKHRFGMRYPSF